MATPDLQIRVYRNGRGWTWAVIRAGCTVASCELYHEHTRWRGAYDEARAARRMLKPVPALLPPDGTRRMAENRRSLYGRNP